MEYQIGLILEPYGIFDPIKTVKDEKEAIAFIRKMKRKKPGEAFAYREINDDEITFRKESLNIT